MSPPARSESLAQLEALIAALKAKGIVSEEELAARQASTDRASPETGARMVARAWLDPDYRALLLRDGARLLAGMDEVGRGSLAGPVSVGVVVVDATTRSAPKGVADSKLLARSAAPHLLLPPGLSSSLTSLRGRRSFVILHRVYQLAVRILPQSLFFWARRQQRLSLF